MKKKLTIPLLVLALVLWGVILYRVLAGGGETTVPATNATPQPQQAAATVRPETDSLLLNYADPFLAEAEAIVPESEPTVADDVFVEEMPYVDWSQVQYLGSVTGGEAVALVMINGHEYMLKAGDTVAGYTLVGQAGHSIAMSYEGQLGTITMQGNNER